MFSNHPYFLGMCRFLLRRTKGLEVTDWGNEDFGVYVDQMSELSWGRGGAAGERGREVGVRGCSQLPRSMEGKGGAGGIRVRRAIGIEGRPYTSVEKICFRMKQFES